MDSHELAWAAGFFDGEGWASRSGRGVRSRINQAGPNGIPEVLTKFHRIVGVGRVKGPILEEGKRPLYYWEATSRPDVARVAELIGPWLCQVKRAQFERTLGLQLRAPVWPGSMSEELAWAGGFFDGEGSSYLLKHRTHLGYFAPGVEVPQSDSDAVPEVLIRFREALSAGRINGPYVVDWADKPVSRWKEESLDGVQLVIHRLMPFISTVKREQAVRVLMVLNSQPSLARGNPAFGVARARYCLRGHDKWNARIKPFKGRGTNVDDPGNHLRQCLTCAREGAQARRRSRRNKERRL